MLPFVLACGAPSIVDVSVAVHPEVGTILQVTFTADDEIEEARVEYAFEGEWLEGPRASYDEGTHTVPVLGLPADTAVELRVVAGEATEPVSARTDPLPEGFPVPTLVRWDPALSSSEPWLLTTVGTGPTNYSGPFWAYIIDRQGRVVWYRQVSDDHVTVMSRVSADGTHLTWGEVSWFGDPSSVQRATLDLAYTETVETPLMGYTYDELPDGTIAYDQWTILGSIGIRTASPDGTLTDLWSCTDWLPDDLEWGDCGTNTVLWNEVRDSYFWSLYHLDTVLEIDATTGSLRHSWGTWGSDPIEPPIQLQHYPNWTLEETLLLSTQEVGEARTQWAREYALDEATGALEEIWSYATSDHYAECSGEAVRLDDGNTLLNYGCGGAIREVTPEGELAWEVQTNELVGHQTLIRDLYELNRGPP